MRRFNCIMLVDDDHSTNYLHKIIIEEMQIAKHISIALNGRDALDKISAQISNDECPDIIFLDINMPVMDGFEFLEKFNELNFTRATPIVVMVTSSLYPADIEKARHLLVSDYILKPLDEEVLATLFKKHFS